MCGLVGGLAHLILRILPLCSPINRAKAFTDNVWSDDSRPGEAEKRQTAISGPGARARPPMWTPCRPRGGRSAGPPTVHRGSPPAIGIAPVCTPVTNAPFVCLLLLLKKTK